MGQVSDYLLELIIKQVDEFGIVVWFDPENHYNDFAKGIDIPNTNQFYFDDSFIDLRSKMDDLLNDIKSDSPPRILVYIPKDESETQHSLVETTSFIFRFL